PKGKGKSLYDNVYECLNLEESQYFVLSFYDKNDNLVHKMCICKGGYLLPAGADYNLLGVARILEMHGIILYPAKALFKPGTPGIERSTLMTPTMTPKTWLDNANTNSTTRIIENGQTSPM
ncbi:hypothetical protein pdam_00001795, partial [Pocillopora damicornis]